VVVERREEADAVGMTSERGSGRRSQIIPNRCRSEHSDRAQGVATPAHSVDKTGVGEAAEQV
jgi:hypothetical protein